MEDQQPDPGDLTTEADRTGDVDTEVSTDTAPVAPAKRRRWPFGRRTKKAAPEPAAAESDGEAAESADEPVVRKPVGKSRRGRHAAGAMASGAPVAEATAEPETAAEPGEPEVAADPPVTADEPETAEKSVAEKAADETVAAEAAGETDAADETAAEDPEATDETDASPEPEPVLVPHQPAGKRLLVAATVAAALFVGAAAFAGSQLQPYLTDRAAVDIKLDIARTAAEAITTLWTYTPDDMETLPDRSSRFLTGEFAEQYRRYIDAIVATNKQAQVSNSTEVMGTAVESLTPTEATAIVYTNSVSTSPVSKNIPSLRYQSYRLTLERQDADWMITRMNAVTNLDLTPQI